MDKEKEKKDHKHETDMEHAKEMLDEGIGMGEIKNSTGLDEKDVNKARRKLDDEGLI